MKQKMELIIRILFPVFLTVYLVWRIGWTIPFDHGAGPVAFSLILLMAEIVGMFEMLVYFYTVSGRNMKQPPLPEWSAGDLPDVDVFVPTYGEPVELLRKTLVACLNMEYDGSDKVKVYLCDDAGRDEMKALAEELNVIYLARKERAGAKAGNLNYAMSHSSAPLIAVFDADMCPQPGFLTLTVPYFLLEQGKKGKRKLSGRVGYVQTPQQFRNADLFQRVFRAEDIIPNEQDYFYRSLEPARNKTNSVIFGGSNTVLLRKALEEAGGFVTESLTEDFATGIEIQKKGYTCYAIPTALAEGLSPESLPALIQQRKRWARGCIQAGRCTKLLRAQGLTFIQRLSNLTAISYWYAPIKRLIYLTAPLLYAVFGITVMRCSFQQMMIFWLPVYLCAIFGIWLLSDGIRTAKWTNIYEICLFPFLLIPVLAETLHIKKKEFVVTDKSGEAGWRWSYPLPFLLLTVLSLIGIVRVINISLEQRTTIYLLLLFWLIYNLYHLLFALLFVCGCRKLPHENDACSLVHDLKQERFGRTGLFAILIRMKMKNRKEKGS